MSKYMVKPDEIRNNGIYMEEKRADLDKLADAVLSIQKNLGFRTSQSDQLIRRLNEIETNILEEAVKMSNLSKALIYIADTYDRFENRIIDNSNGKVSTINKILEKVHNSLINVLKVLNLDDDYYRYIIGTEEFDREKAQEKMMDLYLQRTINNLLKEDRFSEDTWNNATPDERKKILMEFMAEINAIMGTSVYTMEFDDKLRGTGTRGQYYNSGKKVVINPDYLDGNRADSYMIMRTMIHEMRHAYQHAAVENPDQFLVSKETRDKWADNFKDYKDADTYGYEEYVTQPIEYDAKNFAEQYGDIAGYTPKYGGSWV